MISKNRIRSSRTKVLWKHLELMILRLIQKFFFITEMKISSDRDTAISIICKSKILRKPHLFKKY